MAYGRGVAVLVSVSLAFAQSFQQQGAPPETTIRINVNLVQLDAVVTDSKDRPVTDLKMSDFIILQDRKPQPISNFSFVSTKDATVRTATAKPVPTPKGVPALPPPPPREFRQSDVRRTIALVVDDLGLSYESIVRIRQAIKKWVDNEMQPGDAVAVIRTSAGMGAFQQFTSDKRQLYAAIDRVKFNGLGRVGVSSFAPLEAVDPANPIDTTAFDEERERAVGLGTLGAIHYVIDGLREFPGRKSVILFSESMRQIYTGGPDAQTVDQLQRLGDAASRSSVVIHAIDPRGVAYTGLTAADDTRGRTPRQISAVQAQRTQQMLDSQDGMVQLTKVTGGLFEQNSNDISRSLRKVVDDGDGYYLLGYHPDASTFDEKTERPKYHSVSVRLRAELKKAGLRIRSRQGFVGTSTRDEAPAPKDRRGQITKALISPFSSGALHLRLTTLYTQTKTVAYVNAMLHFDPKELKFEDQPDDWHKAVVDTVAITFGADGQQVDATDKTWTIRAQGKDYENLMKNGALYNIHVPVKKAGGYQMRVVLRDAGTEQVGSATQFIEVPDVTKGRLTLSGIVLTGDQTKPAQTAEGAVQDEDPNATAAVRIFKPGTAIAYGYQILNAQAGPDGKPQLDVQTRLFRDGEAVYTGKAAPMEVAAQEDAKRLVGGGRMQLGKIAPGDYVLQVIVTDKLAKDKYKVSTQSMDFEVR